MGLFYDLMLIEGLFLLRTGINAKRQIQRTKTYNARKHENNRERNKHDTECARNGSGEIKRGKYQRDNYADDAVGSAHVLFHDEFILKG